MPYLLNLTQKRKENQAYGLLNQFDTSAALGSQVIL